MVAERGDLPPPIPADGLARAAVWPALKRWERRELGGALRRLGLSYREIGAVIPVGRGTLSAWCRDVELTEDLRARLAAKQPAAGALIAAGRRRREENARRIAAIQEAARQEVARREVTADRFTCKLHLHSGQDESERKLHWSIETGIPVERFTKSYVKPEGSGHRKNELWSGTMTVRVRRSSTLFHRSCGWISGLREHDATYTLSSPGR